MTGLATSPEHAAREERTTIYKRTGEDGELAVGFLDAAGSIHRLRRGDEQPIGRVDAENRVFRRTTYDERELGSFTTDGQVKSHGLFDGGVLGWVDPDGVVVQGGLIFGEEEVGRGEGPRWLAAGAALLLLFLPEDAEANRREAKRQP